MGPALGQGQTPKHGKEMRRQSIGTGRHPEAAERTAPRWRWRSAICCRACRFRFEDMLRMAYTGTLWDLFNPFALLCGLIG